MFKNRNKNSRNRNDFKSHRGGGRGRNDNFRRFDRNDSRRPNQNTGRRDWQTVERLSEPEVGITQYISKDIVGFHGIIKSRFSDFHVNEIDLDGNEAVLSDFSMPEIKEEPKNESKNPSDLKEFLTEEQLQKIQEMVEGEPDKTKFVQVEVTNFDKDQRTKLHKLLNESYGRKIFNNTVTEGESKFIQVKRASKKDPQRARDWLWPHEYTYFILHKENIDTLQAIASISQQVGVKPALFVYAGTKDKRAKTSQWICVKKMEPSKICQAAKKCQGIRVGNFKFKPEALKLGDLKGNRFRIALRSVSGDHAEMEKALTGLRDSGFINYYGMQRFGNCVKIPTYAIGKALLRFDYKLACDLILSEREGEPPYMQKMRKCWAEKRSAEEASRIFHSTNTSVEARLLKGLVKHGETNYLQALLNIPRNMLLLYTHSYQSLIWNQVASKRRELGMKPVEGDLVYTENQENPPEVIDLLAPVDDEETEIAPESTTEPTESKFMSMVRPLTADDIKSEKFTIYDIVLPLPGYDIKYPANDIGKTYSELLEKDELSSEKLKNKNTIFSLGGAYRRVFVKPDNCTWKFLKYDDAHTPLVLSDYEKMMKDPEPVDDVKGQSTSLILDLILPSSTYATMALREIMKSDTSVANQIALESEVKKNTNGAESTLPTDVKQEDVKQESIASEDVKTEVNTDVEIKEEITAKRPAEDDVVADAGEAKKPKVE